MSDTNYAAVLTAIRPGTSWVLNGNDYAQLEWLDDSPKPTKKTLDDAWPQVELDVAIDAVRKERARLYAQETDGIYFQAIREEGDVTVDDWKAAVQAVKDAHPWPQ